MLMKKEDVLNSLEIGNPDYKRIVISVVLGVVAYAIFSMIFSSMSSGLTGADPAGLLYRLIGLPTTVFVSVGVTGAIYNKSYPIALLCSVTNLLIAYVLSINGLFTQDPVSIFLISPATLIVLFVGVSVGRVIKPLKMD